MTTKQQVLEAIKNACDEFDSELTYETLFQQVADQLGLCFGFYSIQNLDNFWCEVRYNSEKLSKTIILDNDAEEFEPEDHEAIADYIMYIINEADKFEANLK